MKQWGPLMKQITLISQFGISLVVPLLLCLFLCSWLTERFALGSWIYIPGFILGLGSSAMTAYKLYLTVLKREQKEKKPRTAFNRHS